MGWATLENTPIELSPNQLATDEGWTISEGIAYHAGCFPGVILLKNIAVEADKVYVINYTVESYVSGDVYPIVGGVSGTVVDSLGKKQDTIVVPEGATDLTVRFYSDGELGISYMNIYPILDDPNNAVTLGFNAGDNLWTTYYSWEPGCMLKFMNDFYSWSTDGALWKHNVNPVRNLFYGIQSYSEVQIVLNINYMEVKNLYSMRVNSNLPWAVTDIYIRPTEGKEDGQRSVIKKGNFVKINGQWFADFLKNMIDPRFSDELTALFQGGDLQCATALITLKADDTVENRLVSVDFLDSPQPFTY